MIQAFENMLRQLFLSRIDEITDEGQVRFQPPDQDWRTYVNNFTVLSRHVNCLNIYLVDLRENRLLHSNERVRESSAFVVTERPLPRRIDLHYLISAWSPATVTPNIEPTLDEHALLYKVIATLMNGEPLIASDVYAPNPLPAGFPPEIAHVELPTNILPVDGFPKIAEFWGTFGTVHPWKPSIYFVATLPVVLHQEIAGAMVTTRITEYRQINSPAAGEMVIEIGGTVLHGTDKLAGAWVRIEDSITFDPISVATTDENGRFLLDGLQAGTYQLRVRAQGLAEKTQLISVPSPSGNYDVQIP